MGGLIFLTIVITCSVVSVNGNSRRNIWAEGTVTHEPGQSDSKTRVVCFFDTTNCGILQRWGIKNSSADIKVELYFPKKYLNGYNGAHPVTTVQLLSPIHKVFLFPFEVPNPIYGGSQGCKLFDSIISLTSGYYCNYDVTINLWNDNPVKLKHGMKEQIWKCWKVENGIRSSIDCRKMLITMLPIIKHRVTEEERPIDLSIYKL